MPRPASRSSNDGQNVNLPLAQPRDDTQQTARQAGGAGVQQEGQAGGAMHAPQSEQPRYGHPPPPRTITVGESPRTPGDSRVLGVHNILNPTEPEPSERWEPRYGGGPLHTAQSTGPLPPYQQQPSTYSASGYTGPQGVSSTPATESSGRARKIPIPRSPRAISFGGRTVTTGTIDAQQSPFLGGGRMYTATPGSGPGSEVPPLPPPPPHYTVPMESAAALGRRKSMPRLARPAGPPVSDTTSPSSSIISPLTGSGPLSPRQQAGIPPPSGHYFPGSSFGAPRQAGEAPQAEHGPPGTEGPYMTSLPESMFHRGGAPSGGQNPHIRFMPISTEHGPMYVPVDVQAASKMADEKRARNAGASARFRERRKQKEKEAMTSIQKLEQQLSAMERRVRDAELDRDFYRGERDRFRDAYYSHPATRDRQLQVPISPRLNRPMNYPPPPPSQPMYTTSESGRSQEEEPPRSRRKTGEYTFAPAPPPPTLPPYQSPIYSTRPDLPPLPPPLRSIPAPPPPPPSGTSGPPQMPPVTTRPAPPYEPYPPRSGYDRGWPPEEGGQR